MLEEGNRRMRLCALGATVLALLVVGGLPVSLASNQAVTPAPAKNHPMLRIMAPQGVG